MINENNAVHVLLVEDDEIDIEAVKRVIKKTNAPIQLQIARNGVEALDVLYGRNGIKKMDPLPSLIFLDINMPKINGLEFLKMLREDPGFEKIEVVMLTNSSSTRDRTAAFKLNVLEYLIKPLQLDKFTYICNKLGFDSE